MKRLLALCALLSATPAAAEITYVETFDDANSTWDWSSNKVTTSPSGEKYLGPFGAETVTVVVPLPADTVQASVRFETLAIGSSWNEWVPSEYGPGPAYIALSRSPLAIQGTVLLEANGLIGARRRISTGTLGYPEGDRAYSDGWVEFAQLHIKPTQEYYTLEFTGHAAGIQWGLDNVEVVATPATTIPEPGTLKMLLLGMIATAAALWAYLR